MDSNKAFRAIGSLTCLGNGSALTGLLTAWILKGLSEAHFIPTFLSYSLLFTIPVLGVVVWKIWHYEFLSEKASKAEKLYRFLPLIIWIAAYAIGVIHFT